MGMRGLKISLFNIGFTFRQVRYFVQMVQLRRNGAEIFVILRYTLLVHYFVFVILHGLRLGHFTAYTAK